MKWKHFPHFWSFVWVVTNGFPSQMIIYSELWCIFVYNHTHIIHLHAGKWIKTTKIIFDLSTVVFMHDIGQCVSTFCCIFIVLKCGQYCPLNQPRATFVFCFVLPCFKVNSLWPSDSIWWHMSGSTLVQVMAYCLTYLKNWIYKNITMSPSGYWVKALKAVISAGYFTHCFFRMLTSDRMT